MPLFVYLFFLAQIYAQVPAEHQGSSEKKSTSCLDPKVVFQEFEREFPKDTQSKFELPKLSEIERRPLEIALDILLFSSSEEDKLKAISILSTENGRLITAERILQEATKKGPGSEEKDFPFKKAGKLLGVLKEETKKNMNTEVESLAQKALDLCQKGYGANSEVKEKRKNAPSQELSRLEAEETAPARAEELKKLSTDLKGMELASQLNSFDWIFKENAKEPAESLLYCGENRIESLSDKYKKAFFESPASAQKAKLWVAQKAGEEELEEALKKADYNELSNIARRNFYTSNGIKAAVLYTYKLFQSDDFLFAMAHLEATLKDAHHLHALLEGDPNSKEEVGKLKKLLGLGEKLRPILADKLGLEKNGCAQAVEKSAIFDRYVESYHTESTRKKAVAALGTNRAFISDYISKNFTVKEIEDKVDERWIDTSKITDLRSKELYDTTAKNPCKYSPIFAIEAWFGDKNGKEFPLRSAIKDPVRFVETVLKERKIENFSTFDTAMVFKTFDERGVKSLTSWLSNQNIEKKRAAIAVLGEMQEYANFAVPPLISFASNEKEDLDSRLFAIGALGKFKEKAKAAIPILIAMLSGKNESLRESSVYSLYQMGDEVVPHLLPLISDAKPNTRGAAVMTLGFMQKGAKEALPHIIKATSDPEPSIRQRAALAIGQITKGTPDGVKALLPLLEDKDPVVVYGTANALGIVGENAHEAIPALVKLLPDSGMSNIVLSALHQIGEKSVSTLIELLSHESIEIRRGATQVLAGLGPKASKAVPALTKALSDNDLGVVYGSVGALYYMGDAAASAAPALIKKVSDPNANLRIQVLNALGKVGDLKEVAPVLIEAFNTPVEGFNNQGESTRLSGELALVARGKPALPYLKEALKKERDEVNLKRLESLIKRIEKP